MSCVEIVRDEAIGKVPTEFPFESRPRVMSHEITPTLSITADCEQDTYTGISFRVTVRLAIVFEEDNLAPPSTDSN